MKIQTFSDKLSGMIRNDPSLNNYAVLAPKGLSTALKRNFLKSPSTNGSLLTIQEIFGGIVKRGIVNVMMDRSGLTKEMFSVSSISKKDKISDVASSWGFSPEV
jgi:microsomal triglyceride transfer protein large subunit